MKYLSKFKLLVENLDGEIQSLKISLERDSKWSKIDRDTKTYSDLIFGYKYEIIKNKYLLVLCRGDKEKKSVCLYFDDKGDDGWYFIDNIFTSYTDMYKFSSPMDRIYKYGEDMKRYLNLKNKVLSMKDDIDDFLLDLTDSHYKVTDQLYGYTKRSFPKDEWDKEFSSIPSHGYTYFKYVIYMESSNDDIDWDTDIRPRFNKIKKRVKSDFGIETYFKTDSKYMIIWFDIS